MEQDSKQAIRGDSTNRIKKQNQFREGSWQKGGWRRKISERTGGENGTRPGPSPMSLGEGGGGKGRLGKGGIWKNPLAWIIRHRTFTTQFEKLGNQLVMSVGMEGVRKKSSRLGGPEWKKEHKLLGRAKTTRREKKDTKEQRKPDGSVGKQNWRRVRGN